MPLMPHSHPQLNPGADHGTTLIELLVAMVTAIVVVGGLLAILEFSVNQEARISNRVQANRIGRLAMTNIIDRLHSSCTGFGASAIQAPSTTPVSPLASSGANDLWFLSAYGSSSSGKAVPTAVIEHDIHWASTGTSQSGEPLGTLTDYQFPSSGGSSPNWQFPEFKIAVATSRSRAIATNVSPPAASAPIFSYSKFRTPSSAELIPLTAGEVPLSTNTAKEVAQVAISFVQTPEGTDKRLSATAFNETTAAFSDTVVLRLNPPETGAEAKNEPCA
jgi:hypothetical protein